MAVIEMNIILGSELAKCNLKLFKNFLNSKLTVVTYFVICIFYFKLFNWFIIYIKNSVDPEYNYV